MDWVKAMGANPVGRRGRLKGARLKRPKTFGFRSTGGILSAFSVYSILSFASVLSAGSAGSILSIGSTGSILSIGCAGSLLSVGGAGTILNRKRE